MNLAFFLLPISRNHNFTSFVLRHSVKVEGGRVFCICCMMSCSRSLLILPIWFFAGLINLHGFFSMKLCLWSFRVRYALFVVNFWTLLSTSNFLAISEDVMSISAFMLLGAFWKCLVIFSLRSLRYSLCSI